MTQETRALYPTVTVLVPPSGVVALCAVSTALTDTTCAWPSVPYVGGGNSTFTADPASAAAHLVTGFVVENVSTSR